MRSPDPAPARAPALAWAALAAALAVGTLVRAWDLGGQVVGGDEFHGLRAAARYDSGYLFTHNVVPDYEDSDYSIPLALVHHALVRSVGLGEWGLRLPVCLGGTLLLVLVARFAWRRLGALEAVVAAWLVALSPLLVLYSRFARPYGLVALCTLGAFLAWLRFRESGAWRFAWLASASGALAVFLNLVAAPAVLAVWVAGLASPAADGARGGRGRWSVAVLAGLGLALLVIAPSWGTLGTFASDKAGAAAPGPGSLGAAAAALFGVGSWLAGAFGLAVLAGLFLALRRGLPGARLLAALPAAQLAAILLVRPQGADHPTVLARYLLGVWPGLLLFGAVGLAALGRWCAARAGRLAAPLPALALVLAGTLAGPLPGTFLRTNSYTNHRFVYTDPDWSFDASRAPAWYREARTPEGTLVEAPWTLEWSLTMYGFYQELHRRPVRCVSIFVDDFRLPGMRFATMVPWGEGRPDFRGLDTVIVHKDVVAESYRVTGRHGGVPPSARSRTRWGYQEDAKLILRLLRQDPAFRPSYEDDWIVVMQRWGG